MSHSSSKRRRPLISNEQVHISITVDITIKPQGFDHHPTDRIIKAVAEPRIQALEEIVDGLRNENQDLKETNKDLKENNAELMQLATPYSDNGTSIQDFLSDKKRAEKLEVLDF